MLSAEFSNEDNFALGRLAKAWGVTNIYIADKPDVPERADGRLRVADVNPNRKGVQLIAQALGLLAVPVVDLSADVRCLVMLGATCADEWTAWPSMASSVGSCAVGDGDATSISR